MTGRQRHAMKRIAGLHSPHSPGDAGQLRQMMLVVTGGHVIDAGVTCISMPEADRSRVHVSGRQVGAASALCKQMLALRASSPYRGIGVARITLPNNTCYSRMLGSSCMHD